MFYSYKRILILIILSDNIRLNKLDLQLMSSNIAHQPC